MSNDSNEISQSLVVLNRIKNNQCPICGEALKDNHVIVQDARFGQVKICNTHKVAQAGKEKHAV